VTGARISSLKTQGAAMVLEMLRPLGASIKMYKVDSTIHFGGEVVPRVRSSDGGKLFGANQPGIWQCH
jgi:hypothetical protein